MHLFIHAVSKITSYKRQKTLSLHVCLQFKKRQVSICGMFVRETLTVDVEEQRFAAVKLKRVCLPPSGEGADMSQSLSWKLRRKL